MKYPRLLPAAFALSLALIASLALVPAADAQEDPLPVSLPDTSAVVGDTLLIPVILDAKIPDTAPTVFAFQFTFTVDTAVVEFTEASIQEGALSEDFELINVNAGGGTLAPNEVSVAAASTQGIAPGAGPGVLLYLKAVAVREGTSPLAFTEFMLNEGAPASVATDGSVTASALLFNEVLYDPPDGLAGDANGDGVGDASADGFVEIVNVSGETIDLGGYTLSDAGAVRHSVPGGTTLAPGEALVVFGGGAPTGIPVAAVQTATTGALNLDKEGDVLTLRTAEGAALASLTYGASQPAARAHVSSAPGSIRAPLVENQSIARDPDFTGDFVPHTQIDRDGDGTPDGVAFSPGIRNSTLPSSRPPVRFADGSPTAVLDEGVVILSWATLIETNNSGFQVQKKKVNEPSFGDVPDGFVPSQEPDGTTHERLEYSFHFDGMPPGRYELRLKQISENEAVTYSPTTTIDVEATPTRFDLSLAYPNPVLRTVYFNIVVERPQRVRVEVYNMLGQHVKTIQYGQIASRKTLSFEADDLASGLYLIRITGETFSKMRRVTVVR